MAGDLGCRALGCRLRRLLGQDAKTLSEIGEQKIDEVLIDSCMTNIGHFRVAGDLLKNHMGQLPTRLWVAPSTKMD